MPRVPVDKLKPGMKLAKPVTNPSGMTLLGEGTELTDELIERLNNMNITSVHIEGASKPQKPKEELLAELDARFEKTKDKPYMSTLKKLVREHIEDLYK